MLHPASLWIPFMILLPNLIFLKLKPQIVPSEKKKSLILAVVEGIGRFGVIIVPIFFSIQIQNVYEIISLIVMLLSLFMYYFGWVRYFRNNREFKLLFSPLLGVPVPLAIFPILYFLFASVITHSTYLFIFSVIFAIGHIPNSLSDYYRSIKTK
ncbi:hypothetical protein [Paenibacillus eucommiae]|uniref:Uncharacterized protein n=1 Tax=Paenibacillus eucommiae TaxID=1355755 RepID=A0ABS4J8E9_9BACL|nr:hypothetical protein [Paenibacillus eucommiae]MBP1995536.1 hypothetical protein [Paenibacillus eucommiae]